MADSAELMKAERLLDEALTELRNDLDAMERAKEAADLELCRARALAAHAWALAARLIIRTFGLPEPARMLTMTRRCRAVLHGAGLLARDE